MNARERPITLKSLNTKASRGIHFLYGLLIRPKSASEDSRRHEFILNIILSGFIALLLILDFLDFVSFIKYGTTHYNTPVFEFSVFTLVFVALLAASRKGYFRFATYAFLFLYYLSLAYSVFVWGVELPLATLNFVVLIVISSILVSTRFSFLVTGIVSATLIGLGYFQIHGILAVNLAWRDRPIIIHDPIEVAVTFFLIVILSWLSNREIESSLKRARRSESELKTERDNLEITVLERTRELKDAQLEKTAQLYRLAEFGRLSQGLFHDLMNPLNGVIAGVSDLETNAGNVSEVKESLDKAVHASKRMGNFLGTIQKQIDPRTLDSLFSLNKELRESVDMLKFRARAARVVIHLKESKILETFGNPLKFHQVAMNLLVNAIDACEGHTNTEPLIIHARLSKFDGQAQLKITDPGCGIPQHLIDKVFDPFFTTKSQFKGMGLGLSTTKSIVEKDFGGTISVSSIPDHGTSFTILFPLRKVAESSPS